MKNLNKKIGKQIQIYRKNLGMTLQQLADQIHKSRASVSKYENGEITLDVQTLFEIGKALDVPMNRLINFEDEKEYPAPEFVNPSGKSPFFTSRRLYLYFYDGRYERLKDGIIDIHEISNQPNAFEAKLSISALSPSGKSIETFYSGKVVYSDMLIRFSFVNQHNYLEEDLLYIFNPLDIRESTEGLLTGISSADLKPCAFKCIVSLHPKDLTKEFRESLLFKKNELARWQKLNMMLIDNL